MWQQWQETAPGYQTPRQRPQQQQQQQLTSLNFDDELSQQQISQTGGIDEENTFSQGTGVVCLKF